MEDLAQFSVGASIAGDEVSPPAARLMAIMDSEEPYRHIRVGLYNRISLDFSPPVRLPILLGFRPTLMCLPVSWLSWIARNRTDTLGSGCTTVSRSISALQ